MKKRVMGITFLIAAVVMAILHFFGPSVRIVAESPDGGVEISEIMSGAAVADMP